MKKLKIVLFMLLLSFSSKLFADEFTLKNVPQDFTGTYMPVQMEMLLKEYMSYEKALDTIAESSYDILQLREDRCYTQLRFCDGYAVKAQDFEKWTFVPSGKEKYILDENGLSYRKISNSYGEEG